MGQALHASFIPDRLATQHHDIPGDIDTLYRHIEICQVGRRMRENIGRQWPKPQPTALLARNFLGRGVEPGQQQQAPVAIPTDYRCTVYTMCRLLKSLLAALAETIVRTPADLLGLQPAILREAKYRCPHQALADSEARHCLYQAA